MALGATQQIVRDALSEATAGAEPGSAAADVLKQFVDASETWPLLCAETDPSSYGSLPGFGSIRWQPQAVAALSYAMVFEYAFQDLVTASVQLLQMFMPRYHKNQFQQSRRAMAVLVRSMRYCLTSEGEQAVVTAVISLLALNVFVDGTIAVQALTKMALVGLEKKRNSPVSKLAMWGVTNLVEQSAAYCYAVEQAGGHDVLVHGLAVEPLCALTALARIAERDSGSVWKALVELSGLDVLVKKAQAFELQSQTEVEELAQIIGELQKLLQHPHQQEVVLQQLKSSNTLELLFVCAKANVAPVSQAALNCLVLIWQWYLRKSPSASFSDSQLSCFLGTDLSDAAVAQDKAILDTGSDSFMMPAYAGQQQQQQDRQAMHGANADPGVWRASPHDSMASQIQSHPHKQQQQQQHQPQPSKGFAPLQQQQASQHTQEQQQHLWSETPVVNFAESAVEVLPEGNAGAVPSSASKQTSSRSTGGVASGPPHMIALDSQLQQPPATPKVDEWMSRSSRRSSSFLRRSFDAWNGLFSSSHRSSTSAMVSPHKAAQPSAAHAHRQSFASFRRPPKPGKADNMGTSLRQANGYNITKAGAAVHNTAVQPNIGDQPSHRSPSSLPMMRGGNAHPLIPACLQSPAKLSIGPQSQTQSHQQQHRQQHRLHASQYAPTSSAAESLAGVAQPQMQSSILSPYGQQQASVAQAKQQERGLHSNAGQQRLAEVGSIDCIAAAAVSPHEVKRRQPDALQYIQTWLDANPEGHWHPMGDKQGPSVNQPLSGTSPSPDRGALMRKGPLPPKPVSLGDLPQKGKVLPRTRIQETHFDAQQGFLSTQPLFKLAPFFPESTFIAPQVTPAVSPRGTAAALPATAAARPTAVPATAAGRSTAVPATAAAGRPIVAAGPTTAASHTDARAGLPTNKHAIARSNMQAGAPSKQLGSAPLGPQTPELKRPTQRVLKYSPISVMQPGANTEVLVTGKLPMHRQSSAEGPSTPSKDASEAGLSRQLNSAQESNKSSPMRADSVWESPAIASSASGSSMLSAQKLEATATSIIGSGQVPVDSVSKVSHDSQPILGVTPVKQAQGMQERAQQDQSYTMGRLPSAGRAKGKKNGWQKFAACFAE